MLPTLLVIQLTLNNAIIVVRQKVFICKMEIFTGTQILVGGGISNDGYEPTFEVISLTTDSNQLCRLDQIFAPVKDIHVAGISENQPLICGKLHEFTLNEIILRGIN